MSHQIRYRCNACGETFDGSSRPENLALNCPSCQSEDVLHVPAGRPLDNLRDRFGDSLLVKTVKGGAVVVAVLFSLILLLGVLCIAG